MASLGASCCDIRDKTGFISMKKRPREEESCSSSADKSFVASLPDLNLHEDVVIGSKIPFNPKESVNDGTQGDKSKKDSTSPNLNRCVTLKLTCDSVLNYRLYLSRKFLRANGMTKPGFVTLVGKDGIKKVVKLLQETSGRMSLGSGWIDFANQNKIRIGDSFTLESIGEDAFRVLSLLRTESKSDRRQPEDYCTKATKKKYASTEPSDGNKNNREERGDSSSSILKRFVTLGPEHENVRDCTLHIPIEFMISNGIDKPGKITFLGKDDLKWWGYRSQAEGPVAMGIGWRNFCEANGVKFGESFRLEFISEQDNTTPVLKLWSSSGI